MNTIELLTARLDGYATKVAQGRQTVEGTEPRDRRDPNLDLNDPITRAHLALWLDEAAFAEARKFVRELLADLADEAKTALDDNLAKIKPLAGTPWLDASVVDDAQQASEWYFAKLRRLLAFDLTYGTPDEESAG